MASNNSTAQDDLLWYKDAVIYELHIKAFRDGDADGIGDFKGLLEKLDYLHDLGITAIWLLPFYPSPQMDDGYDIADYYSINPAYGDIRQFRKFLKEAHRRNLKVITELVINHTSDQHPWFQRARRAPKNSVYRDFYVWSDDPGRYKDARIIFQDFETSNWTWDPVAKQYFWHRFYHHQPDLNYDSPHVQEEIFRILDYWCEMGVDGFRLDAIPYLFEREGTNCENLPETHAFLKKLRKHVDEHYPGTLLLAEANMWPEDSVSYFGNADECHMNYHFPVMPRMFMALQMEDRYPITDIFAQTPVIPPTCQWAIFLRNHDELTLEMVTDEERDYMYQVYVKDPKARINLGIRHRLAPLMRNNRRMIELLNCLLFSLQGTPVIYYGDEIGMGDNVYLGDRNGVRTPMQWNADRNAGFSEANPQKLYLPVILDPEYHYDSVNVEIQRRSTSSLLWWTKRLIDTRKKYKAFSRGDMNFIDTENAKVLAFTRTYENEVMLVLVNLSRYSQPAELDLSQFKGHAPVEVFSKNRFPMIREDAPYFFTLGPYDCQWFQLQEIHSAVVHQTAFPVPELQSWKELEDEENLELLAGTVLPVYMSKMRWFGGKARVVQNMQVIDCASIPLSELSAFFLLIEVTYKSGLPEVYQLPVAFAKGALMEKLKSNCPQSVISPLVVAGEEGILYDGLYGNDLQLTLIRKMAGHAHLTRDGSDLTFYAHRSLRQYVKEHDKIKTRMLSAEQSNSSVVYDNDFFLKIYRKVDRILNPDLELTRFLTEKAHFKHIPDFIGAIEWRFGEQRIVLGMMQKMIRNATDTWTYLLDRLNRFNEKILSGHINAAILPEPEGTLLAPVSYADVPYAVKELLDGTEAEWIRLLGVRTGEMHLALASASPNPDFRPEPFSLHYQRSLYSSFQTLVRRTFQSQARNIRKLPAAVVAEAEEVLGMRDDILKKLGRIHQKKIEVVKTRIHGDYHLGQTLFTGKDFVILDFEGEPSRSFSERRLKRSPLRDVAGMIRSFHYAAYGSLFLNNQIRESDVAQLVPFLEQWYHYTSGFFMQAYLETVKESSFIPANPEDLDLMIQTYILEKSIYELNYELNNRPEWVIIPLRGIRSIMHAHVKAQAI